MADPVNALGFCSWGLLGAVEGGEGPGETIYVLDLGVDVEMQEPEVDVDLQLIAIDVAVDELAVTVELEDEEVLVETRIGPDADS